jgi:hypothetical protein
VVDEAGGAVVAWSPQLIQGPPGSPVYVAIRPPGGQFEAPFELGNNAGELRLSGNGRGDALVIWQPYDGLPRYSFRPAGGNFGPATDAPSYLAGAGLDADGSIVFISSEPKRNADARLTATVVHPSGETGPTVPIPSSEGLFDVRVAAAPSGRILVVGRGAHGLVTSDRPPAGEFAPATKIRSVSNANPIGDVKLASSGAAVISSQTSGPIAVRLPGEPFRATRSPSPSGQYTNVAIDEAGNTAVAWQTGGGRRFGAAYRAARQPHWTERLVLASDRPFPPHTYEPPGLAIDGTGTATAVWEESDGDSVRTVARDFRGSSLGRRTIVGSLPAYVAAAPPSACRPAGSKVLRSTSRVTIFKRGGLYACLLERGAPLFMGGDSSLDEPFPSHTMAIAGPLVAYGDNFLDEGDEGSIMLVVDLRDPEFGINRGTRMETTDYGILLATVLRRSGAVAWLSCPDGLYEGGSAKDCRRRERVKHVWVRGSRDGSKRLLDSGRAIDARTFKLRGSLLSWRHGGKLRHARLR